jgi:hypothetical protein
MTTTHELTNQTTKGCVDGAEPRLPPAERPDGAADVGDRLAMARVVHVVVPAAPEQPAEGVVPEIHVQGPVDFGLARIVRVSQWLVG